MAAVWATVLQRAIQGPPLATPEDIRRLPVIEREVQRTFDEGDMSPAKQLRVNRLILEAALPGSLRQLYSHGWRPVMWAYGLIGILVAAAFWVVIRDRPAEHPRMTADELADIEGGRAAASSSGSAHRLPIGAMLASRSLWLVSLLQFSTNIGWTFLVLQLPTYLTTAQNCSLETQSWHSAIPLWAGWGGMLLGGWLTDWCVRRFGLRLGRMIPLSLTRFLAAGAFAVMMFEPSLWVATTMFCLVAFSTDVGVPAVWAYNQDVGGRFIASVLGWGNMWGNIGSALSPLILAAALERSGGWTTPFLICAIAFGVAGLCGLYIDATKPIDVEER
jgi:nitrate/nitrite transporter NarK